ncbi:MAG: DNA-binding response regulator [Cohnella sp.]|nr:DNA-binding response regulator [Cohnella sp.]
MRANEELQMDRDLKHAYDAWLAEHIKQSKGERRRRLEQRIGHAEKLFIIKIWWPLFGHLNNLHPEFEVKDFRDGWRFLDFAYILSGCKICIEIDGFGPHWRDINRNHFSDQLMRQNHLVLDGWLVLRFSYDDILEKPRACQSIISQLIGRWASEFSTNPPSLEPLEMLLYRIALSKSGPLTPAYAAKLSGLHRSTTVRHLRALTEKRVLAVSKQGTKKICSYRVNPAFRLTP